jgi:alpha-ketoglutarate-dependent taurine dioxygenase
MPLTVHPLSDAPFGATIQLPEGITDPSTLNDDDFKLLHDALHEHSVLVIPNQKDLEPHSQWKLTARLDPTTDAYGKSYGHGKEFRHSKSVLAKDGTSIPSQPQVQVLGQGKWEAGHHGMGEIDLTHPTHFTFHKTQLTDQELAQGQTRYYRWHIDSALYGLSPPVATTLLGIHVPPHDKTLKVVYEDTKEEKELTQGATAFISGKMAFDRLSPEDKELALKTTVVYAPHPYIFISPAKATSDGLTMISEDKEMPLDELPQWEESKIKCLPLVWTNPVTGNHHLQVHGCCVWRLERPNGETLELEAARKELHRIMRPAIAPEKVYAHSWTEGDLVIFHNRGVWHAVTGQFKEGERRLMHQCNIASGRDPVCVRDPSVAVKTA